MHLEFARLHPERLNSSRRGSMLHYAPSLDCSILISLVVVALLLGLRLFTKSSYPRLTLKAISSMLLERVLTLRGERPNDVKRELEILVKERENAGDLKGALELLLEHHTAHPTRSYAVRLAHELSQRYQDVLHGCPLNRGCEVASMFAGDKSTLISTPQNVDAKYAGKGTSLVSEGSRDPVTPPVTRSTAVDHREASPWERGWKGPKDFKPPSRSGSEPAANNEAVIASLQNFTVAQLNMYDGGRPRQSNRRAQAKEKPSRPIYIAIRGKVYDASDGRHIYGPGGKYHDFAGHDISRRVARGLSAKQSGSRSRVQADDSDLDNLSLEGLGRFELMTLVGWEDTFAARGYRVVGRVVAPPSPRRISREELRAFDGSGRGEGKTPPGYATPPIYLGVKNHVFDVSFGGSEFYTDGGEYQCLAGRDASRVLAKMSMSPEDIEGLLDYSCLTEREAKNLDDWVQRLGVRKGYPVVGWMDL